MKVEDMFSLRMFPMPREAFAYFSYYFKCIKKGTAVYRLATLWWVGCQSSICCCQLEGTVFGYVCVVSQVFSSCSEYQYWLVTVFMCNTGTKLRGKTVDLFSSSFAIYGMGTGPVIMNISWPSISVICDSFSSLLMWRSAPWCACS